MDRKTSDKDGVVRSVRQPDGEEGVDDIRAFFTRQTSRSIENDLQSHLI